jgi:hypothetical protein
MLYAEYDAEHYAPLVESDGLRLAHTWRELLDLLELAIAAPDRDRAARARMVEAECGTVDGCAAERVARTLIGLAAAHACARMPANATATATTTANANAAANEACATANAGVAASGRAQPIGSAR